MHASLVPDLAHASVVAFTMLVALLCAGVGAWTGARRMEVALLSGWGISGLVIVAVGTIASVRLSLVLALLFVVGLAGHVRAVIKLWRGGTDSPEPALFFRVFLLALPFFAGIASMETIAWDDFDNWLPNLAYLCQHDHFPTLEQPNLSHHPAYPYGLALPGLAVFRLFGSRPDNAALTWNLIMVVAVGASMAHVLRERLITDGASTERDRTLDWGVAAVGLLLAGLASPTFVAKILFSNMADSATGAVLAILISILFDWVRTEHDRDARVRLAFGFGLGCVALANLRQANGALLGLMFLGMALAYARQPERMRPGVIAATLFAAMAPSSILFLWDRYAAVEIPEGRFALLGINDWRWHLIPRIVGSMARVMLAKTGLFVLLAVLLVRACRAFRRGDALAPASRAVVITGAIVSIGMIGFLGFTYLAADFSDQEAAAAASFWRYSGETGSMAVLAAIAVIPLGWVPVKRRSTITVGLVLVTMLLPIVTVRQYRADLTSPVPDLQRMADTIRTLVPRTAPIALVDLTGDGFANLVIAYELGLSPSRDDVVEPRIRKVSGLNGIAPNDAMKLSFVDVDFIWLAEGAPEMARLFGPPLSSECSYLLKRDGERFAILRSWKFGRFPWATFPAGWAKNVDQNCR
jgi:hypothetical protein